jgi:hypothetical protein
MNKEKVIELINGIEVLLESLKEELKDSECKFSYEYEEITPYIDDDDVEYYDPSQEI